MQVKSSEIVDPTFALLKSQPQTNKRFQAEMKQLLKDDIRQLMRESFESVGEVIQRNLEKSFLKLSENLANLDNEYSTSTVQDASIVAAKKLPTLTTVVKLYFDGDEAGMQFVPLALIMTYEVSAPVNNPRLF